uniref:hypothetical protein n=1 Tax=Ornithobacterium rhinotracheale TaxID=28251 RepID=UPI0039A41CF0
MRKEIFILAFVVVLISCGKEYEEKSYYYPNPKTEKKELKTEANDYYDGVHVPIYDTQDIDEGEVGEVYVSPYVEERDFKKFYEKHMQMKKDYEELKKRYDIIMEEYMKLKPIKK